MLDFLNFTTEQIEIFLLISFRAAGLFIAAPVIGHQTIPVRIKAAFAILLAMVLIPVAGQQTLPQIDSIWLLAGLAVKEMMVGFIIGFFFALLFIGVRIGGNIIGYQIGLIIASLLDPETNSNESMVGEFMYILATLIFLAIDGHHYIISAFADSYKAVPVGVFNVNGPTGELIIRYTAVVFTIAFKLGAPVIITLFLTTVALGVVARTAPQMNIFIVGIPIKIGIGFLVMATSLPIFRAMLEKFIYYLDDNIRIVMRGIGTA